MPLGWRLKVLYALPIHCFKMAFTKLGNFMSLGSALHFTPELFSLKCSTNLWEKASWKIRSEGVKSLSHKSAKRRSFLDVPWSFKIKSEGGDMKINCISYGRGSEGRYLIYIAALLALSWWYANLHIWKIRG